MYNAPIKDMQFILNELIDMDALAAHPGFEDVSSDLVVTQLLVSCL